MQNMPHSVRAYWELMRLDRPIGTILLLWPTLAALWLSAKGLPPIHILLAFILGVVVMRACGCVINDIADRKFDPHVKRTQNRPLADGRITVFQAWTCFFILALLGVMIVLLFLNTMTWILALIGLGITCIYPFLKRVTHLPQLVLGVAFSWGILMADTAINNTISLPTWVFFTMSFVWIVAYDTEYAMVDREDDIKLGLKSIAILFGKQDRLAIILLELVALSLLVVLGLTAQLSLGYYVGIGVIGILFVYQWILIRNRDPSNCFRAFKNNGWVGLVLFLTLVGVHIF